MIDQLRALWEYYENLISSQRQFNYQFCNTSNGILMLKD